MDTWRVHLPPPARPLAIRINALGFHHARRLEDALWSDQRRHALIWVTQGSGFLYEASRTIPIRAGHVYRLDPGRRQRHGPAAGTVWQEHWISFQGLAADALMHDLDDGSGSPILARSGAASLAPYHHAIREAVAGSGPEAMPQAGLALHRLILAIAALRSGGDDAVAAARREMAAAATSGGFDCRAFCARRGIPPHRFRRQFLRRVGQAPLRHFLGLRMRAAADALVAEPERPVADIAARFALEPPWFSRLFSRHIGLSPAAWRRSALAG